MTITARFKSACALAAALMLIPAAGSDAFAADDVYLSRKSVSLNEGESASIRLVGAEGTVKWRITDSDVFTYSKGRITAVGEGTAYLYAVNGGKSYRCKVEVTSDDEDAANSGSTVNLSKGGAATVYVNTYGKRVRVRSSNADVCTISCGVIEDNRFPLTIKAKSSGSAVITVYDRSDKTKYLTLTVKVGASSSKLSDDEPEIGSTAVSAEDYADEIIRLVNEERESAGLSPLEKSDSLSESARIRAKEIAVKFSHTRPDGSSCFTAIDGVGAKGENIAYGYTTPETVMSGWMSSPGHMENILGEDFTHIGVAYDDSTGCWVQVFFG